ncbi:MAG: minor capsid protein [Lachnospiraceae bacterium]
MAPLTEFLDVMIDTIEKNCHMGIKISLIELKPEGGIYAELGDGFTESTYYNKQEVKNVPVLFLCRHKEQRQCMEWLGKICHYLQRTKQYPCGNTFSWLDASVKKEPGKIGRDEDGVYHYSCILTCKIYY